MPEVGWKIRDKISASEMARRASTHYLIEDLLRGPVTETDIRDYNDVQTERKALELTLRRELNEALQKHLAKRKPLVVAAPVVPPRTGGDITSDIRTTAAAFTTGADFTSTAAKLKKLAKEWDAMDHGIDM